MALPNRFGPPMLASSTPLNNSMSSGDVNPQNSMAFAPRPTEPYQHQPSQQQIPQCPPRFSAPASGNSANSQFDGTTIPNQMQFQKDRQASLNGEVPPHLRTLNGPALNGPGKLGAANGPYPQIYQQPIYNQGHPNSGRNQPFNVSNSMASQTTVSHQHQTPGSATPIRPMGNPMLSGPPLRQNVPHQQVSNSGTPSGLFVLGSSEPNSARSSRNPSPISNRQYDSMEGQFPSPRPSPVSSSTNIAGMVQPATSNMMINPGPPGSAPQHMGPLPGQIDTGSRQFSSQPRGPPPSVGPQFGPAPRTFGQTTQQHMGQTNSMQFQMGLPTAAPNTASQQRGTVAGPTNTVSSQMQGQPALRYTPTQQVGAPIGPQNTSSVQMGMQPGAPQNTFLPAGAPPGLPSMMSGFSSFPQPPISTQQFRPVAPPTYMSHSVPPGPVSEPPIMVPPAPGPPIPPVSQPTNTTPTQPFSQRPRYPQQQQQQQQQTNYSQSSTSSQSMISAPSIYGVGQGNTQLGGGVPDGPVGGVPGGYDPQLHANMAGMSIHNSFSRMWGNDSINLLQDRHILPPTAVVPPKAVLPQDKVNCSTEVFRCTVTKIPETSSLLQKSRLPLGILIHPFKDMTHLPVIQCNTIVRCRSCRTYINPFVSFVDQRRWKCNLCYRINDLPEEFFFDPSSGTYGDPTRRPEIRNATIEFIAPSEYMLRPPQPAIYLFLLDVSHGAVESGYLSVFCQVLQEELRNLPGDARTRVGLITFDSSIHFYSMAEGMNRPNMMVVSDTEDMFIPLPDNLLVNLSENKTLLQELLSELPNRFSHNDDTNSALGAALQAAFKLVSPVGGRVTVMQSVLPNVGPGALKPREDPNQRAAKEVNPQVLGPANDFYKKLALDCSGQQVAVDLFLISTQYADVATLACASKFSAGCLHYYPGFHLTLNKRQAERFECDLRRYLTRKVGFEAVMRIRCTRGLTIHTFHGNFFVRSTDLLSLPNVNPDSGFGMQISIEENLTESNIVCFQAAVLYTSSKGERRIRVHTLSLPVSSNLTEIMGSADQQAIIGLLCKMAVDRSLSSSLSDARDALINASIDILSAFKITLPASQTAGGLVCPFSVRLVPLYIIALLKHPAFRVAISTKLDERVYAMEQMKTMPLVFLMTYIYPNLYPVHALDDNNALFENDMVIPQPPLLQLTFEKVDRHGAYLLETTESLILYVGRAINDYFCTNVLGVANFQSINENATELIELDTPESHRLRNFISWISSKRPFHTPFIIIREDSKQKHRFLNYMVDDRSESSFSYYEFLQHLKQQVSK